jgi:hypothetical protein
MLEESIHVRAQLDCVRGKIGFVPRISTQQATYHVTGCVASIVDQEVEIRDARPIVQALSLDREGFILVNHEMSALAEGDPLMMRERYTEEMGEFLKNYLKASWVVPYTDRELGATLLRSAAAAEVEAAGGAVRKKIPMAHMDFSAQSAPVVAAGANRVHGIPARPFSRMILIQTWCALTPAPQDFPLAIVDGSTVADSDLVEKETDGSSQVLWVLHHSPTQKWYYFSNMKRNEIIFFMGYDSQVCNYPRAAHSSFDNRAAFPNASPRTNIESRFWIYFE